MIIFGTRGSEISGEPIENVTCPSCQHEGMHSSGVVRYFHVYWIPIFPTKKEAVLTCPHCKCCLVGSELDPKVNGELKQLVFTGGRTWMYSFGLWVMGGLFLIATVQVMFEQVSLAFSRPSVEESRAGIHADRSGP